VAKLKKKRATKDDDETVLFDQDDVFVSATRVTIHETMYPTANITSVRVDVQSRPWAWLFLAALLLLLAAIARDGAPALAGFLALSAVACGLFCWLTPPKHWVSIGSAGGEKRAVFSTDPEWSGAVVEAINDAIVARG
jgi:Family of unknown function (DUF6232)